MSYKHKEQNKMQLNIAQQRPFWISHKVNYLDFLKNFLLRLFRVVAGQSFKSAIVVIANLKFFMNTDAPFHSLQQRRSLLSLSSIKCKAAKLCTILCSATYNDCNDEWSFEVTQLLMLKVVCCCTSTSEVQHANLHLIEQVL